MVWDPLSFLWMAHINVDFIKVYIWQNISNTNLLILHHNNFLMHSLHDIVLMKFMRNIYFSYYSSDNLMKNNDNFEALIEDDHSTTHKKGTRECKKFSKYLLANYISYHWFFFYLHFFESNFLKDIPKYFIHSFQLSLLAK